MKGLIIIDAQRDFTEESGSLYVEGAERDMENIATFIQSAGKYIDSIIVTFDWHSPTEPHIFSQGWWKNIEPFTPITLEEFNDSKFAVPAEKFDLTESYLQHLKDTNQSDLMIWPDHCIAGTDGAKLDKKISKVLSPSKVIPVYKGQELHTESYGFLVPCMSGMTDEGKKLLNILNMFDELIVCGEAMDFCVWESLKQLVLYLDVPNIIVMCDCMSPVIEDNTVAFYKWMEERPDCIKSVHSKELAITLNHRSNILC